VSRAAALTVILLAGALSTAWAFLVPIFQAPDEPAHFDYAMSVRDAGRLVGLADGRRDWIVTPYTRYLMQAADFDRIVWHSSMRVPQGYGSRAYFARMDAGAPNLRAPATPTGTINYIAALYPFGFYALEALWIGTVAHFAPSLVTVFFAARLLCVGLMMLGLYFNYRTALNLGLPRWTSVALTAAIGFFPLTSFVSSYVQPDNLAYALVSASLFFATGLRGVRLPPATIAGLGVSLGLLAVTKYQFFISVALPVLPLAALRLIQWRPAWPRFLAAAAALLAPALILLAIQHSLVTSANTAPVSIGSEPLRRALAAGLLPGIGYVVSTTVAGFTNFFLSGSNAVTFWQTIGWVDTPIVILNTGIELLIRSAISLATLAVAVVLIYYGGRNALVLARAARLRHRRLAGEILLSDPVLNSYLCFAALMLALYVVSNNAFGAEGRQWYPFIFPAFLCFIWYAPRALAKRHQMASAALAGTLAAYSLIAGGFALHDLRDRYYGPQLAGYVRTFPAPRQIAAQDDGVLWPIQDAAYHVNDGTAAFAFARGLRLLVDGAALSPRTDTTPAAVAVLLDGRVPVPVLANQYLYTIAEATHRPADGYSGFYANIATARLSEGPHFVTAFARFPGESRFDRVPPTRLFFVTHGGARFSAAFAATLARLPAVAGSLAASGVCEGSLRNASTPVLSSGAVALLAGRIAQSPRHDPYVATWLLLEGRPYPARFTAGGSFVGTIPTQGLGPGLHLVTAFALTGSARSLRIGVPASFRVAADSRTGFSETVPAACSDPLEELAQA
jgi:hypothetical protein